VLLLNLQEEDEEEEEVPAFRLYGNFVCGVFFSPLFDVVLRHPAVSWISVSLM
jgi:hypothetical protein